MTGTTDTIKGIYAAFAEGDIEALLEVFDPEINWTEAEGFPYGGTYVGPDAVLENVFIKLGTEWEGWTAIPYELISERDTVVALGEYCGTYKLTGKSIKAPFVHVWKFIDEKVVSFQQHTDTAVVQRALK